ncbi:PilT/PilU family type 4a pilus ATPase [bacterium]|nr:PilT/PilU family type 4a pilus ATPase [bacterium]
MARIDAFLRLMIEQKASDLHFIAGGEPVLRVDGDLLPVQYRIVTTAECLNLVNEILPQRLKDEFEKYLDVDFAYQIEDKARFRVSLFRHHRGVGATFRLIPLEIPTIQELHLPEQVEKFAETNQGLVLMTGSTGSGKSTTLAAIIDIINQKYSRHILTIEDPVEFVHKHKKCMISQLEIGIHTADYHSALQNTSRNSADIIMLGELRDSETILQALAVAETGSLVFGTLHTQSCASAISRIIDVFPGNQQAHIRSLLSVALKGVISQQLIRRRSVRGRVPVAEIMFGSPELSQLIRKGRIHQITAHSETAGSKDNVSRDMCLGVLLERELISLETATSLARDPGKFNTATG